LDNLEPVPDMEMNLGADFASSAGALLDDLFKGN
jgi:hypothetical protein